MKAKSKYISVLVLAVGFSLPAAAAPQAAPAGDAVTAPPVEELVTAALESSPTVAAARARLEAAREMVSSAGALPNPMVELTLTDIGFPRYTVGVEEMSMIGPEVRQDIPYPGKRQAARDVAGADSEIRGADLEVARRTLAGAVRAVYARVYALDREAQALAAAGELLDMLAATAASRYAAGEAEQEAVLKAQLEVSRVAERRDDLAAERAALVAGLNRLLDRPGAAQLGIVVALPPPAVPPAPWEDLVVGASAEIAARRAAVAAAERRLDSAKLDAKPDMFAGAAVGLRGGYDPAVTLRFGAELPLWRNERQKPMVRAAELDVETARAEVREAEAAARSDAGRLAAEWSRSERQITRYQQAILPQTSAAVDAARSSYLAGRGDFSTVVEDFNAWLDARTGLARREADRFAVWAELQALLGEPDGGEGSSGGGR